MSQLTKVVAPAAERNAPHIVARLREILSWTNAHVLEVASGTGQHCVACVSALVAEGRVASWQPTELMEVYTNSVTAYVAELSDTLRARVQTPRLLDATVDAQWDACRRADVDANGGFDLVFNANMIHISPFAACQGLFRGAGRLLKAGSGALVLYGPFAVHGSLTPQSNVDFDASLKSRDASWGIRDIDDCEALATQHGMVLEQTFEMPANNKILVFRKNAS